MEDIIHASGKTGFGVEIYWPPSLKNSTTIRRWTSLYKL
jgi:hypothetical protein